MEHVYVVSSSKKVLNLEKDLIKELNELKSEIENGDFLKSSVKSFSSLLIPKDADYFCNERKLAVRNALEVRSAMPLLAQSDAMEDELKTCIKSEYSLESLALLLHQFFTDRVEQLILSKYLHMLRWARFCENTKSIESLYPEYQRRLMQIMMEYGDAVQRAQRLAQSREYFLTQAPLESSLNVVLDEDLAIYTRWLVCHFHSMKRINSFLKVIQWFPQSHRIELRSPIKMRPMENSNFSNTSSVMQAASKLRVGNLPSYKNPSIATVDENIPMPPPSRRTEPKEFSVIDNRSETQYIGDRDLDMTPEKDRADNLPVTDLRLDSFRNTLDALLKYFQIDMTCGDLSTQCNEMDMYNMVLRTFKQVFETQESMRTFDAYDYLTDMTESQLRNLGCLKAAKKQANWLDYIQLTPEVNGQQLLSIEKLKQKNYFDDTLRVQAKFLHLKSTDKVIHYLQEHLHLLNEMAEKEKKSRPQSSNVTTHRKGKDTSYIWSNVFSYTLKGPTAASDVLNFDAKIGTDDISDLKSVTGKSDVDANLVAAAEKLGLDEEKKKNIEFQGAYMSFLALRHLRLRDLQRTCLSLLNYFRSVERTLTINDVALTLSKGKLSSSNTRTSHACGSKGLGSHEYMHNSPTDFIIDENEFMSSSEIENHDDFYTFQDGRIHVQDQRGFFIVYDVALEDFRNLEEELLLIVSHFMEKATIKASTQKFSGYNNTVDIGLLSNVDRFDILLDIWESEISFLECKRDLIECYMEAYQHVNDVEERHRLAQVTMTLLHKRARIDFEAAYFIAGYRLECEALRLQTTLLQRIIDVQVTEQREYVQKVCREEENAFGLPLKVVPIQHIAINPTRLPEKFTYMLEFHPSLGLVSRLPETMKLAIDRIIHNDEVSGTANIISKEITFYNLLIEEWNQTSALGQGYSAQVQKDIFSEVFIEDPLFVCEVGLSLTTPEDGGGKKNAKAEKLRSLSIWTRLLEAITLRHRLIEVSVDSQLLTSLYQTVAREMSIDECHASLRCVPFDFATAKSELEMQPYSLSQVLDEDPIVDRYYPATMPLAIQEFDEKHVGAFSFRNREGLINAIDPFAIERLQTVVMTQISHKNSFIVALHLIFNSLNFTKDLLGKKASSSKLSLFRGGMELQAQTASPAASRPLSPSGTAGKGGSKHLGVSSASSLKGSSSSVYGQEKFQDEAWKKLQRSFMSVQGEKSCLRDRMLNTFILLREKNRIKTVEEIVKLKSKLLQEYCFNANNRLTRFSYRAQIISYYYSLQKVLSDFPTTRDSHFVLGVEKIEEEYSLKKKKPPPEQLDPDPYQLKQRPRRLLSTDGKTLLNLWYIPHYTEVLDLFDAQSDEECNANLRILLRLVSSLHDIVQYLCAHARLGSSHARMGSHKLQFSGVTADWGGTEGIGAGLREIQSKLDSLPLPGSSIDSADYLENKRDTMYAEFELALNSSRDTFLSMGNQRAFKSITSNMYYSVQNISNTTRKSCYNYQLRLPNPLISTEECSTSLFPWRSYLQRCEILPCSYVPFFKIGDEMQTCLAGLKDIERHIVNGEVLGISLQLEDVLTQGMPELTHFLEESKDERPGSGRRSRVPSASARTPRTPAPSAPSGHSMVVPTNLDQFVNVSPQRLLSEPLLAVRFLNAFAQMWMRLELVKKEWGCRRLGVTSIDTVKLYKSFTNNFKTEVLYSLYSSMKAKCGQVEMVNLEEVIEDDLDIHPPENTTEFEIKIRQLVRLLENLECVAISDCIRRISREHTLVLAERSREDTNLPTDLWKKPTMKENFTMPRPQLAEDFAEKLLGGAAIQGESVTLTTDHMNKCLVKLGTDIMHREKQTFESYASFYENLLRQQHQSLYMKEQEVHQLEQTVEKNTVMSAVEVDCMLADKSHHLLLEITALRSRLSELSDYIIEQDKEIRAQVHAEYSDLVKDLFNHAFDMKSQFEQFEIAARDQMQENVQKVREIAVDKMAKVKQKYGVSNDSDLVSKQLIRAEQLRKAQAEVKNLSIMIVKLKNLNHWDKTTRAKDFKDKLKEAQDMADRSTKERLELSLLHEEKELLVRQEQDVLRKALTCLEKEVQGLRKQLEREQKLQVKKTHNQIQEAHSMRQLELAKSSNIEKLIADLEEKDARLKELAQFGQKDQRSALKSASETKKLLRQLMLQVQHERNLKMNAFERVDDLQKQVQDLEAQIFDILNRQREGYHDSCFPSVPGGTVSPTRRPTTPGTPFMLPTSPVKYNAKEKLFVVKSTSEFAPSRLSAKSRPKTTHTTTSATSELPKVRSENSVAHGSFRPRSVATTFTEYQFQG